MTRTYLVSLLGLLVLLLALQGCPRDGGGEEADAGADGVGTKADAGADDAGWDGGGTLPPLACRPEQMVDLSVEGVRDGARTTYSGDNSTVPVEQSLGRPSACVNRETGRQVVHGYRMGSAGQLEVSLAATNAFLFLVGSCSGSTAGVQDCASDLGVLRPPGMTPDPLRVSSGEELAAGDWVHVVVAAAAPSGEVPKGGSYQLELQERPARTLGQACDSGLAVNTCDEATSCVARSRYLNARVGRCVPRGSIARAGCRVDEPSCDGELVCAGVGAAQKRCLIRAGRGEACVRVDCSCATEDYWGATQLSEPEQGRCFGGGTPGSFCDGTRLCGGGAVCLGSRCRLQMNSGSSCDPLGVLDACPSLDRCVPVLGLDDFRCVPRGGRGGSCRSAEPRCDQDLECSGGVCRVVVSLDQPCDPLFGTLVCAEGLACAAGAFGFGRCRVPVKEAPGSNDGPATASLLAPDAAPVRGGFGPGDAIDCYAVEVPAGGAVFAHLHDRLGGCGFGTQKPHLWLFDPAGALLDGSGGGFGTVGGCPMLDGQRSGSASQGLAAGRYVVCGWLPYEPSELHPYDLSLRATAAP